MQHNEVIETTYNYLNLDKNHLGFWNSIKNEVAGYKDVRSTATFKQSKLACSTTKFCLSSSVQLAQLLLTTPALPRPEGHVESSPEFMNVIAWL